MLRHAFSGRFAMDVEPAFRTGRALLAAWLLLAVLPGAAVAQEAPLPAAEPAAEPPPLPVEAEVPQQDLLPGQHRTLPLEEAVFTEISPLTIPEIGIRLPADQQY